MLKERVFELDAYYKVLLVGQIKYVIDIIENALLNRFRNIQIYNAETYENGIEQIHSHDFDMLIVSLSGLNGETKKFIQTAKHDKQVLPVLIVSTGQVQTDQGCLDPEIRLDYFRAGATMFLEEPFTTEEVSQIISNLLSLNQMHRGLERAENIIEALTRATEARDPYTKGHAARVATFSLAIFDEVGLKGDQREDLYVGALLHDIGKIGLPDDILTSPSSLTPDQREIVKLHTIKGWEICKDIHRLKESLPIIRQHHERLDGSGYPDGVVERDISILAQIVGVADVYDALTSDRSYRAGMTREEALGVMYEMVENYELNRMFYSVLDKISKDF